MRRIQGAEQALKLDIHRLTHFNTQMSYRNENLNSTVT